MTLKCKVGVHNWDGCQCTLCGKIRDDHHDWSGDCEKCSRCGKVAENRHDWLKDCDHCHKCGKRREGFHSWAKDCEKCSKCGHTRFDKHQMENGLCKICGHGSFKDEVDGRSYKVVKIGDQILMAENYAGKPASGNFWSYDNHEENKVKFGYLYDFETAKAIAPKGWHLPSKSELEKLFNMLGGHAKEVYEQVKSNGNSGFEGIFAGWRSIKGTYNGLGASAHFWTSTLEDDKHAWQFKIGAYSHHAEFEKGEVGLGLSIRYFKDK
jgi:uncharacterized protein (TIGR02145 family)